MATAQHASPSHWWTANLVSPKCQSCEGADERTTRDRAVCAKGFPGFKNVVGGLRSVNLDPLVED